MIKILFLGANPSDSTWLAIDREVREITQRLRATPHGARFEIEQEWAVQVSDLQAALLRHRPDIVHFGGHGRATGEILVADEIGNAVPIRPSALAELFRILGDSIRCVVLNACYSEHQAEAIRRHVDCVVGMSGAIKDGASIAFSGAFYETLGFGRPVKTAFELGKNQIDLTGLLDADVPKLLVREGVDATRIAWAPIDSSASRVNEPARSSAAAPRVLLAKDLKAAPFTGRTGELEAIDQAFADRDQGQVFVLFGSPGVGKSRLALEFVTRHRARYPGGAFFLPWDGTLPSKLSELVPLLGLPKYPDERFEYQCRQVLAHLGGEPTLLVYDNVPDDKAFRDWLPSAGAKCHVLMTSTYAYWSAPVGAREVGLLPDTDGHILVGQIVLDPGAVSRYAKQIVDRARGVTIELCAVAQSVAYEVRHGREASIRFTLTADTRSSFDAAWKLLSEDARRLLQVACLFSTGHIQPDALRALLAGEGWDEARINKALDAVRDRGLLTAAEVFDVHQLVARFRAFLVGEGWDEARVNKALDAVRDRGLLTAAEVFDVHQLVAHFVRGQKAPVVSAALVQRHFEAFAAAAGEFAKHPGDGERRTRLLAYPVEIKFWEDISAAASTLAGRAHTVGDGLFETGRFDETRTWYERAVDAAQKGDVHGRLDHESLGRSLLQVGFCYWSVGRFDQALPWFERAVDAAQKGDVHGRVDHESMGRSLHMVGVCHWRVGRVAEARTWFERAVEAKQKSAVRGRVDRESLDFSLDAVKVCREKLGRAR
jgi:tetratricopeptide (TPR) repeat protein